MFERIDWRLRFWMQAILDYSGRKIGGNRKTWAINATMCYVFTLAIQVILSPEWFIITIAIIAVLVVTIAAHGMIHNLDKENGEDINWRWAKFWRRWHIGFGFVNCLLLMLPPYLFVVNALTTASWGSLAVLLWVTSCVEAPPKETKRKLARAAS